MFNLFEKIKSYDDKKLIIKVIAGILFIAIAFSVYLGKNIRDTDEITVTDTSYIQKGSTPQQEVTMEAAEIVTGIIVDISGAVVNPSVVKLKEGSRVYEAIEQSGGFTPDAYTKTINLARVIADGEKIYIPTKAEMENGEAQAYSNLSQNNSSTGTFESSGNQGSLININTADSAILQQLPGIGPSTAEKIINYRNEHGRFKNIDDIKNVSGIGEKTFEKFKSKITV